MKKLIPTRIEGKPGQGKCDAVLGVHYYISEEFTNATFDSCKEVKLPSLGIPVSAVRFQIFRGKTEEVILKLFPCAGPELDVRQVGLELHSAALVRLLGEREQRLRALRRLVSLRDRDGGHRDVELQ